MKKDNMKTEDRRTIFKTLGIGAAATALFSLLPFKSMKAKSPAKPTEAPQRKIKVTIHPAAVKRQSKEKPNG